MGVQDWSFQFFGLKARAPGLDSKVGCLGYGCGFEV